MIVVITLKAMYIRSVSSTGAFGGTVTKLEMCFVSFDADFHKSEGTLAKLYALTTKSQPSAA